MDKASVQLGLSSDQVEKVFLHRNIQSSSRRSVFIKPVSIVEAKNRRDCLSMLLYSRLFEWLVNFINSAIVAEEYNSTIGLLDIYGFEKFDNNSLEQLCINYANEKIQQHYVAHFMKDLQKEYEVERIEWNSINYNDNQHCLNVLEGKHSIFGVLNEEVFLSRKSNKRVLGDRLLEIGSHGDKPVIKRPKKFSAEPGFIVRHYADDVKYTVDQLVTKNKDNISLELIRLLKSSEDSFIQELFSSYQTIDSPGKKKRTVLAKFKKSLDELMLSLNQSEVHYIRCIKPNMKSHPGLFDRPYVTQQLRANGILETVEICKQGYPARIIYWEFLQRYGMLIPEGLCLKDHTNTGSSSSDNDNAFVDPLDALLRRQLELPDAPKRTPTPKKILRRRTGLSPGDHARRCCSVVLKIVFGADQMTQFIKQFGKSKLFLLQSQLEMLESSRALVIRKHIIVLQWAIRRFLIKARFHRKFAVKKIWRCWIKYRRRRREKIRNIAASIIQRAHRNWRLRNPKVQYPKQYALQMINGEEKHISNGDLLDNKFNLHQDSLSTRDNTSDFKDTNMENMISSKVPVPEEFTPTSKNYSKYDKIPGSIVFPDSNCGISPNKGKHHFKRIMETSVSEDETENDQPPLKKLKVACKSYRNLKHIKISDGILTKRRLPQADLRFHTRPSVLKNAHIAPMKEIQCSLTDCLKHSHLIDD